MEDRAAQFIVILFPFAHLARPFFFEPQLFHTTTSVIEKLQLNKLRSLKSHGGVDRALLSFDLKVDLTPAFHWNIKQLFVYVVAVYETEGRLNQVVLWDKIVQASDPDQQKHIDESNVFVKYALVDQGDELRGKDRQAAAAVGSHAHHGVAAQGHATVGDGVEF